MKSFIHTELELLSNPVGDWATWLSVGFSVTAAIVAGLAFLSLRKRERRQALTELHVSLTSGETAAARNAVGTLLYSPNAVNQPSRLDGISAYFALIWSLQRARNVFRTQFLPSQQLDAPMSRWQKAVPRRRLRESTEALTWNLTEIADNIVRFHDEYGAVWEVEDEDAWAEISEYVNADRIRERLRSRNVAMLASQLEVSAHGQDAGP